MDVKGFTEHTSLSVMERTSLGFTEHTSLSVMERTFIILLKIRQDHVAFWGCR